MNFDKIIKNIEELQSKVEVYELEKNRIDSTINSIKKDIIKLEKKIEKEQNELNKNVLQMKRLIMKDILNRFQ